MTSASDKTARIRALNDQLRQTGTGGRIVTTRGVAALDTSTQAAVFAALRSFDAFTPDNDPYGEHDCASFDAAGQRFIFKIDTYDLEMDGLSPDPADAGVTRRVMTVMLAEEY
jgi:hypothetical protein